MRPGNCWRCFCPPPIKSRLVRVIVLHPVRESHFSGLHSREAGVCLLDAFGGRGFNISIPDRGGRGGSCPPNFVPQTKWWRGDVAPAVSLHCFLFTHDRGDVAPAVSLHCFLFTRDWGGRRTRSVSALLLVYMWLGGTSHAQCLCTASCYGR